MPYAAKLGALQKVLEKIDSKPRGVDIDFIDDQVEVGVSVILVCAKPVKNYVRYLLDGYENGVRVFYIMARGEKWIQKADEIAKAATSHDSQILTTHSVVTGKEELGGKLIDSQLITLLPPPDYVEQIDKQL